MQTVTALLGSPSDFDTLCALVDTAVTIRKQLRHANEDTDRARDWADTLSRKLDAATRAIERHREKMALARAR